MTDVVCLAYRAVVVPVGFPSCRFASRAYRRHVRTGSAPFIRQPLARAPSALTLGAHVSGFSSSTWGLANRRSNALSYAQNQQPVNHPLASCGICQSPGVPTCQPEVPELPGMRSASSPIVRAFETRDLWKHLSALTAPHGDVSGRGPNPTRYTARSRAPAGCRACGGAVPA